MIVVTGGAGFIGSNIVAGLTSRGETEVVVSDWLGSDEKWRNLGKRELAHIIRPEDLFFYLEEVSPEVQAVIHMGAISSTTETDADLIVENNFRYSLELWDWCTRCQVPFIYASSGATYGDGSEGFDDDAAPEALSRLRPLNAYGWSKHLFDRRVARIVERGGDRPPQWAGLKFFNVYGPNEYHKGDMRSVVTKAYPVAAAGKPIQLFRSYHPDYPDGGQKRDFISVMDCVEVVLWLLDHPEVSGLFNVGTGQARTWNDLATAIFAALGREALIEYIPMPEELRPKYQYFTEASMHRLREAGYERAFRSLEEGIGEYVEEFLSTDDPYR